MQQYLIKRVLHGLLVVIIVSIITFLITRLAPGNPAELIHVGVSDKQIMQITERLGLDRPIHVQYFSWAKDLLTGDFGRSFVYGENVFRMLMERFPATLLLTCSALFLATAVGIPLGIISAVKRNSIYDTVISAIAYLGLSVPSFWLGILMIILFSVTLGWLPSSGMFTVGEPVSVANILKHTMMPAIALGFTILPIVVRYMRSSMMDELRKDYVRTARAKGLAERKVVYWHALRNSLIPVVTVIGYLAPRLMGGAVVIEIVFGWPGVGQLAYQSTISRDYPVVQAVTVMVATFVVFINLAVDFIYTLLDPRIRIASEQEEE